MICGEHIANFNSDTNTAPYGDLVEYSKMWPGIV